MKYNTILEKCQSAQISQNNCNDECSVKWSADRIATKTIHQRLYVDY